jgi:hypothetical protein
MSSEQRDIDPRSRPPTVAQRFSFTSNDLGPILAAAKALLPTVCRVAAWEINGRLGGLGTEILSRMDQQFSALETAIGAAGLLDQRPWVVKDTRPLDAGLRVRDLVRAYRRGYLGSDMRLVTDAGDVLTDGQTEPWSLDGLARRLTVCVDELREASEPSTAPVLAVATPKGLSEPAVQWRVWALGVENRSRWHLFRKAGKEWRQKKKVKVTRGKQHDLLSIMAKEEGFLPLGDAIKLWLQTPSSTDKARIRKLLKPQVSRIAGLIRGAIDITDKTKKPLAWDKARAGWVAQIEIGYAVVEDTPRAGSGDRLRFRKAGQLTADERMDR